jgi:hypothetical protein
MLERRGGERTKQSVAMDDLKEALTNALRAYPECDGIRVEKIIPLVDAGGVANWDAQFVSENGGRPTSEQRQRSSGCRSGSISPTEQATAALDRKLLGSPVASPC